MTSSPPMPLDTRLALQDLMTAYCYAVDDIGNVEGILALFTPDAVLDFTALGLPLMQGHAAIRAFFESVFADMTDHCHMITNFRPLRHDGDTAAMSAYVVGLGRSRAGASIDIKVQYTFDCVRHAGVWQCRHYSMFAMMGLPDAMAEIHGGR